MPMITIRYVKPNAPAGLRGAIAALASRLSTEHLKKDPMVTAVLAEPADPEGWVIAGKPLAQSGEAAFWLDIKVPAGTNTKAETTRFVRAAFDGMRELLGPINEESYVLVHAVDGDAYGFGGRTQNARWADANRG